MSSTTRERLEKSVVALRALSDRIDAKGTQTVEDTNELMTRAREVADLKAAIESHAASNGTLAEAKSFLAQLAEPVQYEAGTISAAKSALTMAGLPMNTRGKTFGELFVNSPAYKEFRQRFANADGIIPNNAKNVQSARFAPGISGKSLVTGLSDTSAGAAIRNDMYSGITDLVGERELTIADIVTNGTTESDVVEYVRVTGKTNNAATVPEATSSAQPAVYNAPTGGELTAGGYKPESGLALAKVSTNVKTIAHWMPITKRASADAGQVRTLVDNFLKYGLNEKLEDQILSGNGTGENFTGILNSGILTVGSAGTDIDAVVDAIRTVRVTGRRRATAMVVSPTDWYSASFLLAKDGQQRYLLGDPGASPALRSLWNLNVVVCDGMTTDTVLVGDFRLAVLWEREPVALSVSDSHMDFFTRNLLAILAEMRAAFGVLDPEAFCSVTAV
jgi:HK97 family phage major capsid protein